MKKNFCKISRFVDLFYMSGVIDCLKNDLVLFSMYGLEIHQKHSALCSERLFKHVRLFWMENNFCKIYRFLNFFTDPGSQIF